ncbi:efflux RND transporter permease subunit, partial [Xanthomonas citri pv. citri]
LVRTVNQFVDLEEIRNMLVTTQSANGSAADSALQQMFNIAASTGSAAAVAAASAAQSASSGGGSSVVANGMPVRLKDVATVRQGYKEREAIIRLGGKEAVELAIYKEGDANTVATAGALRARLEQIKATFPGDAELTTIEDQSRFIEHAISDVKKDAV